MAAVTTNWLATLVGTDPKKETYPTAGLQKEAEALRYLAESLQEIHMYAHSSKPEDKPKLYARIDTAVFVLSGTKMPEPVTAPEFVAAPIVRQTHIERVEKMAEQLVDAKDNLRDYRKRVCPTLLEGSNLQDKESVIKNMEPARIQIEASIASYNSHLKLWNGKLPQLTIKLARYRTKFIPNRTQLTAESIKIIHRDTGLSKEHILNSAHKHIVHQKTLERKIEDLEKGIKKAETAFRDFRVQIDRAIDAYKYGGVAGKETLGKWNPTPYNPHLKEITFTALEEVRTLTLDEAKKMIAMRTAMRKAKPAAATT